MSLMKTGGGLAGSWRPLIIMGPPAVTASILAAPLNRASAHAPREVFLIEGPNAFFPPPQSGGSFPWTVLTILCRLAYLAQPVLTLLP